MATITDETPDLDRDEELSASSATRSTSAMAQDLDSLIQQLQEASKYGVPGSGSPPLIDFKSLIAPISDDEPAGGGVPFDVRERLEQARKEVNPEAFAADDPLRPADYIKADWNGIIALTQETLRNTSKNLLVAARLVEALTKKHGFAGLRDGFHLMRLLVDICWDRLDPPLEDEDMEVRAAPFNWLDDPDRGAVFPNSIRAVPILAADGNQFSWLQWQQSQSGGGVQEMIDKIIRDAPRDRCQTIVDNLAQAQQELRLLMQSLTEKMGPDAPGFTVVRPAIVDCFKLAQGILQKKGPAPSAEGGGTELSVSDGSGQTVVVMAKPRMSTREDIYQELAHAAAALERLEPHSPVPFLVRRAVELGALPFPLLMQELIRDANVLSEMNRELGIKQRQEVSEGG
jgi:type VI secretion system protein ImpA